LGLLLALPASGQILDARRLGMGGVTTSDQGDRGASNVAFRAVPKGGGATTIPLPLGLIPFLSDMPTFDPDDPDFNALKILDLALNPPLTLSLSQPDVASGDVSVFVGQDSLQIDLADVRRAVPKSSMVNGGVYHLGGVGAGFGPAFVNVGPIVHVRSDFDLGPSLRRALRDAEPFAANTRYGATEAGRAQAAIAFQAGAAVRAAYVPPRAEEDQDVPEDPRVSGATALYVGAAPKILWGLAYADAATQAGITTADTLFGSSDPVSFDMVSRTRAAAIGGAGGMGHGFGADAGAVFYWNRFELGVGANDLGSQIRWRTEVRLHRYDDVTNEFSTVVLATDEPFTSRIPVTLTINAAKRFGRTTIAADVVDTDIYTAIHAGAETWTGQIALRAGLYRDSNQLWQATVGSGIRFGRLGVDAAIATHSRNIEEKRGAELSASLAIY
jgi:hypothetical protein